ncbi:MAG: thioredoxin [Burkholderiales bacterium]|jgi:putative thioredoxin|nr:thioredoxin [Burkholderiales bacterium]
MTAVSIDTTADMFERDVIEASRTQPVVVDFWAPWCGPCRVLKPILEKLAKEYAGKFVLVKLNTDEHPEPAARYGVRGIPNVKAFVDGEVANEFVGALPESGVRAFLDSLVPSKAEKLRRAAAQALAEGDFEDAEAKLRDAISLEPASAAARLELAELLAARGDMAGAEEAIAKVPEYESSDRLDALRARVAGWRTVQGLPSADALADRIAADPADLGARLALGERLAVEARYESAMKELLEVVRRDRGALREQARQTLLRVFSLASGDPDLVREYRRQLASALN